MWGKIVSADKKEGQLKVLKSNQQEISVDYENTTVATEYDAKTQKLAKSGLSRLTEGDFVEIWGLPDDEDNSIFQARRIIRISKVALNPEIKASASPSATPKSSPKTSPKVSPEA